MCGICGIYSFNESIVEKDLVKMTNLMEHRGPDDEGYLLINTRNDENESFHYKDTIPEIRNKTRNIEDIEENKFNLGFGFRRLSIIDLTEKGHQPMSFNEAGLHIVYNGEIYNYIEIREELKGYGYAFKSNTDTEVILKSYHKWGDDCLHKFNGMWAFAIWDSRENKLFCSRDRFGVKPFYFYKNEHLFAFSSEIKPLLLLTTPTENITAVLNSFASGLADYSKNTFFGNIYQLRGGTKLVYKDGKITEQKYYCLKISESETNINKITKNIEEIFYDAVKIRLRSDVEVGFALSGGIDSSAIVCTASNLKAEGNHTFSMVYPGNKLDESYYIDKVIKATRFRKHTISPNFDNFICDMDKFVYSHEEPFGGLSFYGQHKVRELTNKNKIKVCLDGQGADEIFAGYPTVLNYYFKDLLVNNKAIRLISERKRYKTNENTNIYRFILNLLRKTNKPSERYLNLKYPFINWYGINDLTGINNREADIIKSNNISFLGRELHEQLFYTSIPRLLTGADKVAMSFSLECRFPFLDYRLVEYAFDIPYHYKINNGEMKHIFKKSLKNVLPEEIYKRRDKIGFVLPLDEYNENNLYRTIRDKILSSNYKGTIINVNKFIDNYYNGNELRNIDWKFWKTASYLLWYDKFINNNPISTQ